MLLHAARSSAARALRRPLPLRAFSSQAAEPATDKLWIFDTTLRDGEQSPGATLNIKEKVDIGNQLSRLGVDICEAGFPIASQGDFEAVREVAKTAGQVTGCADMYARGHRTGGTIPIRGAVRTRGAGQLAPGAPRTVRTGCARHRVPWHHRSRRVATAASRCESPGCRAPTRRTSSAATMPCATRS